MNTGSHFGRGISLLAGVLAASLLVALPEFGYARGGGGHGGGGGGGGFSGGGFHGADGHGGDYSAPDFGDRNYQAHDDSDYWHANKNYFGEWGSGSDDGEPRHELDNDCVSSVNHESAYARCGSSWYSPRYEGSNIVYGSTHAP
jgi:hypothetical protein